MELVTIDGESYYKITNSDMLRPFFMSIVSDSNHWLFISSNGGITAGRKNAEYALFPYYTDDKITESADITGSKSIFRIQKQDQTYIWEPFSDRFNENYSITRNLYKSLHGNKIIFEEILHDFNLNFSYQWSTSNQFGFIKQAQLTNTSDNNYSITFLDGIQNILPYGVNSDLQNSTSNLVDAYKRSELHTESGLGIFGLSAKISDKAEPSEALKANIAWSIGFKNLKYLLSSLQIAAFRKNKELQAETDIKGEKGAYFISTQIKLAKNSTKIWKIIANVNQNQTQVLQLTDAIINNKNLENELRADIELGTQNLVSLNVAADGLQFTADKRKDTRHFANVLFNIMRGGIFDHNYQIYKKDFVSYLTQANKQVFTNNSIFIAALKEYFSYNDLKILTSKHIDADLHRICTEYLPLKFSRRHGDPSRPWNKFSINTQSELDGSKILDYQGNWRDIFQNWESLAFAYPDFMEGMIFKFLNASTFDGYNPYRVSKSGFDWETIEPDNPWSYIGYWGDHQVIYLLKFLEFIENYQPGKLNTYFGEECFVYAAVPYCIRPYDKILQNPKDTIVFNHSLDAKINSNRVALGADGALMQTIDNQIYHVNFIEKILAVVLAKLSNFIPEAGIWMNTQRPEWNDANNALVGNGVSMVTLYYMRRFFRFFQNILEKSTAGPINISIELAEFFEAVHKILQKFEPILTHSITNTDRKKILDVLGSAASTYRQKIYENGFSGEKRALNVATLSQFVSISLAFFDHTIKANKRNDKLYHAYNLMASNETEVVITHLPEMLEGQVAVISSGFLNDVEVLDILNSLRKSALYRADQNSYTLYPNKDLPGFLQKNTISKNKVEHSALIKKLLADNNFTIVNQDIHCNYHFNGNFQNNKDLSTALNVLITEPTYQDFVEKEEPYLLDLFEEVFNHKAFTGRSGTFYAYEGLGSIYWHMVSKLHLAVLEICFRAKNKSDNQALVKELESHYYEIGAGIGLHKSPEVYGAFPTDPYSHTPFHKGAQQPGMTGQVKEDILTRMGELGIRINNGKLLFQPTLLQKKEFSPEQQEVDFLTINGKKNTILLPRNSLAFSFCQVPIVYTIDSKDQIEIVYENGNKSINDNLELEANNSQHIFLRTGEISKILVSINKNRLK